MFKVKIWKKNNSDETIAVKYYRKFENALSDILDNDSELAFAIRNKGIEYDGEHPDRAHAASYKRNGYMDDFYLIYKNNLIIHIEELIGEDERNMYMLDS